MALAGRGAGAAARGSPPPAPAPSRCRLAASPTCLYKPSRRYLWTDAFGVVNFISLAAETGDPGYLQQAEGLITGALPSPRPSPHGPPRDAAGSWAGGAGNGPGNGPVPHPPCCCCCSAAADCPPNPRLQPCTTAWAGSAAGAGAWAPPRTQSPRGAAASGGKERGSCWRSAPVLMGSALLGLGSALARTHNVSCHSPATPADLPRGGLRIGKVHAEGHPDGDGQYFHYNTKCEWGTVWGD